MPQKYRHTCNELTISGSGIPNAYCFGIIHHRALTFAHFQATYTSYTTTNDARIGTY